MNHRNENTAVKLENQQIKKDLKGHDQNITLVFTYLDKLLKEKLNLSKSKRVGYKRFDEGDIITLVSYGCNRQKRQRKSKALVSSKRTGHYCPK